MSLESPNDGGEWEFTLDVHSARLTAAPRWHDTIDPLSRNPLHPHSGVGAASPDALSRSHGRPLDAADRVSMEAFFGHDFSGVRVHADSTAAASANALHARAYTVGDHIVFGAGHYAPRSPSGRRLLAHELTHVVQQRYGVSGGIEGPEREAQAAERGDRPTIATDGPLRRGAAAAGPFAQCQDDQAAIRARLQAVAARLAQLRARYRQLSDSFTQSTMEDRQRESLARGTERLHAQARSESAARELWGGTFAAARIRRGVSVSLSGNTATLSANLRITYLALPDLAARRQAAIDVPRIEAAIRDVWQVDIATGDYAGMRLRLLPTITYLPSGAPAPTDAFLIQVRGADGDPSTGDAVHGLISLAPVHLQGSRVIVVAHELAHVFGFVDAYLTQTRPGPRGAQVIVGASVGRQDARNRADLLGMIDPVILERWQRSGAVTAQQVARQTGPIHVWEEDASIVLRTLGVAPPAPQRPTPDSEDFDPQVELDRVRRQGESQLERIRTRRERAENSLQSVEIAEQIIALEREERELRARLGSRP